MVIASLSVPDTSVVKTMMTQRIIETSSPAETAEVGRKLAALLRSGDVVALVGPLGAGKTHLVRSIVAALGGDERAVSSPTFALIHEYPARLPVFHFDAYRLTNEAAFTALGVEEYFSAGGVCLIEWADRVPGTLPAEHLQVTITVTGDTSRVITIDGLDGRLPQD